MSKGKGRSQSLFFNSLGSLFSFFFFVGRRSRKTRVFYVISFLPVLMSLAIKFIHLSSGRSHIEGISVFSSMIMVFYLQFLILILALFFGTSVCSEEIEGKTITYLTTRPISKSAIILSKYMAYTFLVVLMTVVGLVLSFLILNVDYLDELALYKILLKYMGVLLIGLICYSALFTFIGTFLKKSILFGLIFSFGWENVIQYFPGSTQRLAIVHYLKSLLHVPTGGRFSFLLFRLEPTPPLVAVTTLFLLTVIFLGLACLIFSIKEYILED